MDSKTWWIIIAIIVVVLILILIAVWQGKRRTAAHRDEAQQLRGRAKDNEGTVVESRHRAESATEQAERARAEADAKQRKADELAAQAKHEQKTAEAVERDHAETLKKADQLDPDTPTDRHGNRVEGAGSRGAGEGESRIDSDTGQPVEEAARERDVRAERPVRETGAPASGAPAAYDDRRDVRPEGAVGDDRPAAYDQQHDVGPEGGAVGGEHQAAGYDAQRDVGPEGGGVGGEHREGSERQHVVRPDGTVGDARPAVSDQLRDVRPEGGAVGGEHQAGGYDAQRDVGRGGDAGSHGVFDRERTDNDLPGAGDGADESDGSPVKDKVNRLFGRHARGNGPEDGVEPPKH